MCTWKAIWLSVLIAASLPFICFCLPSIHTCLQYFISRYFSVVSQLRFQNLWERFFLVQCLCLIWQCKCCSKCILLTLSFLLLINIFLFLISAMAGWRYIPNTCIFQRIREHSSTESKPILYYSLVISDKYFA